MNIGKISIIHKANECDIQWKIPDFDALIEKVGEYYYSPLFSFEGRSWFLGLNSLNSVEDINLKLWRVGSSNNHPIHVAFSFAFKSLNGQKDFEKHGTVVFDVANGRGIDGFMSKYEFKRRKFEFLASGFLTIICTLKRLNSTKSASEDSTAGCSYDKRGLDDDNISSRKKLCMNKTIKCPECSTVINIQNGYKSENTSENVHHHAKILQDLKQLFLKQENYDVVLRVKGQEFQAHKAILTARSPVFASTFRNNMKEKETGIVDIEDCDPSVFPDFLRFLYSGDVDNLSEDNVFSLFTAADKYDIPDLREKCLEFMKENLSIETFCETLTLALQHSEAELIQLSTNFFIKNVKTILVTVKWQSFAAENPTQSNELVIKYVESVEGQNS